MVENRHLTSLTPTVCQALGLAAPADISDAMLPEKELPSELFAAQHVLMLVLDSWGELNWQKVKGKTPYLSELDAEFRLGTLLSVLPSITPVNFASIGTGAEPSVHKVKTRYDQSAAQTIFDAASQQGLKSSVLGPEESSSVLVLGPTADFCLRTQAKFDSNPELALLAARHLFEEKPNVALCQWLDLDSVGHFCGLFSSEHLKTYIQADQLLRQFIPFVRRLGYWTFITADHGMHEDPDPEAKEPGTHGSDQLVDTLVPLWLVPPA